MAKTIQDRIADLQKAIAAQENLRGTVDSSVLDAAIATLREKLAELERQSRTPEQQRKQVTVLFADIQGFTTLSERRDAEEITDLINLLWRELDPIIVEYGGMIDKHMGDAVMALWGADQAYEDDPEQAIRAALAMQGHLGHFRGDHNVDLALRIGINTGMALVGAVGTAGEFSAMGDTVNLTNRLQHAAPAGRVLISHDTYRHVRGVFDVLPQEPMAVQGKTRPVLTYVVEQAKPRAFRVAPRDVQGIETRMVGRDAELQQLQNAFRHVMETAETRMILIVGDAGVGKSRLLYEFDNWIELLPDEVFFFKGRAVQETMNTPYSLFRSLFAERFGIRETDDTVTALDKFRAGMAGILDADRADLVGHLVGFDFSSSQAVHNLLESPSFSKLATAYLTNYLRAVTTDSPTVVFLEDLHWADVSSLALLEHLISDIQAGHLLVVGSARPEFFEHRPDWGAKRDNVLRFDLEPLSKDDSQELVGELLQKADTVPADLSTLVVDGAEGNPFYVEELIQMLIEDNVITPGDDVWRIEIGRLKDIRVPPTLTGVLQARLDGLPSEERQVLQRASVVGRVFWDDAVSSLRTEEDPRIDVDAGLNGSRDRELILRHEQSAFHNAQEYAFKHALLRDGTYETVLLKLRRVYHAQVARWLETNAGERINEYLSQIAGHYELAGETQSAAYYWTRSGEILTEISAFEGAINAFERALALTPNENTASQADLLVKIGGRYVHIGDYPAAKLNLTQGFARAREINDQQVMIDALNSFGLIAEYQNTYDEAQAYQEQALTIARAIGDRQGMARAMLRLGGIASDRGEYDHAKKYYDNCLTIFNELSFGLGVATARISLGNLAAFQGEFEQAQLHYQQSLQIASLLGDRMRAVSCFLNLGNLAAEQANYIQAQQYLEDGLSISQETGDKRQIALCLLALGNLAADLGDDQQARTRFQESLEMFRALGSRKQVASCLINLGEIAADQGDTAAAWSYYHDALIETMTTKTIPNVLTVVAGVARLHAQAGHHVRAAEWLGLALHHPSARPDSVKHTAEPGLAFLRETLPADQLTAALERGKTLDLNTVVAEILEHGQP
jgi:predicted ATPase/class 3 adenylate cyclase